MSFSAEKSEEPEELEEEAAALVLPVPITAHLVHLDLPVRTVLPEKTASLELLVLMEIMALVWPA